MQTSNSFSQSSVIAVNQWFTRELIAISRRLPAAPPIKYGLGYRTRIIIHILTLILTLKVTIIYAVQNDTEIKFNIMLYIVGSEPERTRLIFGQNWVNDTIILSTSKSIWEKIRTTKFRPFPSIFVDPNLISLHHVGNLHFPLEPERTISRWCSACYSACNCG